MKPKIAIEPKSFKEYESALLEAGGDLVAMSSDVTAVIWTDYSAPEKLASLLDANPQVDWVQLPFAGVDAFSEVIERPMTFTSAKGSYSEPVAEHALALALALCRALPERVVAKSWGKKFAVSLYESKILIVGGGGITTELLKLLKPFGCDVTVVRKRVSLDNLTASRVLPFTELDAALAEADVVILAAALTAETENLMNLTRFRLMKKSAYLVNIARGAMVNQSDLEVALRHGLIAGAAIDVTFPEPLPDGHPLWSAPNLIITPHTADTKPMVVRLFSERIRHNVRAYAEGTAMLGLVDAQLGY